MSVIIETRIKDSFSDMNYNRAAEELRVMREELIEVDEPGIYNDCIKVLKRKLLGEELGGDRMEMWSKIRSDKLGLVEKRSSELSSVDEEEAKQFYSSIL